MRNRMGYWFLWIGFSVLASACYYNKRLVYLQGKEFSENRTTLVKNQKTEYRLQPFDIVFVQIRSLGEAGVSNHFNVNLQQGGMFATPGSMYLDGYSISTSGKIVLPTIGEVMVKDLTIEEAQILIQSEANKYLKNPIVIVKLTSYKVTVLGEVKNPGYYYVYNNQVTVLEALGLAGDLTSFGNRKNIKLIRQTPEGSQVTLVDLTDANLLKSEHFFLMPGDVVYVEPFGARSRRANLEVLNVVFTALTTCILIYSYINTRK